MIKSISILLSSNIISQGLPFLALPILTALYTPEQFGLYSNIVAISSILLVVSMGRYEQVQLQISDNLKKCVIVEICFFLLLISVSLMFFCSIFINSNNKLMIIPSLVFIYGMFFLCEKKLNSDEKYKEMSVQKILRSFIEVVVSIVLAFTLSYEFGLVAGLISGLILSSLFALFKLDYKYTKSSFSLYLLTLKEFRQFPLFNMPHAVIGSLVSYLPIILIPIFYDNETLGYYALGMKVVQTPVSLLAASLYSVLTPVIARSRDKSECLFVKLKKIMGLQILIGIMICIFILLSDSLFITIFGENWSDAYDFILYMLPYTIMTLIVMPYSSITNIYFKQKTALFFEITFTIVRSLSLYFGLLYFSLKESILLFSFISMLCMFITLIWYIKLTTKEHKLI